METLLVIARDLGIVLAEVLLSDVRAVIALVILVRFQLDSDEVPLLMEHQSPLGIIVVLRVIVRVSVRVNHVLVMMVHSMEAIQIVLVVNHPASVIVMDDVVDETHVTLQNAITQEHLQHIVLL